MRAEPARCSARSARSQLFGLQPHYSLGSFADRSHVVHRDLSGIERIPHLLEPTATPTATAVAARRGGR
ncbi:hypothetical protein [Nocardia sp. alder85J]|uniref:hypothetical protein n=1 Tax=Nocardia sp. alder85J TaxID=2862949 RepID=UPI001CD75753|nr:hypothetical protein [Nocardia sp. alder85J]MCX4098203.1 hypothetical protein [Nocardia sp. alder85J]